MCACVCARRSEAYSPNTSSSEMMLSRSMSRAAVIPQVMVEGGGRCHALPGPLHPLSLCFSVSHSLFTDMVEQTNAAWTHEPSRTKPNQTPRSDQCRSVVTVRHGPHMPLRRRVQECPLVILRSRSMKGDTSSCGHALYPITSRAVRCL